MPKASTLATSSPATVTALRDVLGVQDVLGTVNIFDDTTAGLAATVDGDYFSVPSADADEYLILYKNETGSATEIKRYPSADSVLQVRDTLGLSDTLGSEMIVNGDFASSTGWTAGGSWAISGGQASCTSSGTLSRTVSVTNGKRYMVNFDMVSRSAGNVQPRLTVGSTDGSEQFDTAGKRRTIITATSGGSRTFGMLSISGNLTIDNVSMKELLRGGYLYAMGDSLTYWVQFGLVSDNYYPYLLQSYMPHIKSINLGVSGNSTAQMVARLSSITNAPYIFIMYGGTNDPSADTTVQASPAPTTTTFSVGAGQGVRYGVGAKILVNGVQAEIQSISTDAITLTSALGFTPTAGQSVKIDTTANLVKMGQHVKDMGCTRILVVGRHFDNWASGTGDTTSAESATNAKVRAWSRRAAATLGAVYVDTYAFMRDLILTGVYTAGDDAAWNAATTNIHLNATGQAIIAEAMYDAMLRAGW